jgi:hypothetical protein
MCLQHLIRRCLVSEKSGGISFPSASPMQRVCSQFAHLSQETIRSPSSVTVPHTHLQAAHVAMATSQCGRRLDRGVHAMQART